MASQVKRDREFQVPIDVLYQVITDFEKYKTFLPEVVGSDIVQGKGSQQVRVRFEIDVMKKFSYELDFSLTPNKTVSWKLVNSDFFKMNQGQWQLEPAQSGTKVHYDLEVAFGFLVPGWITKKLTEKSLPQMFDRFEQRAKEIMNHDK